VATSSGGSSPALHGVGSEAGNRTAADAVPALMVSAAHTLCDSGRIPEALAVAQAVARDQPKYPAAKVVLGRALLEAGRAGHAAFVLRAAAKQFPASVSAHRWLAEVLLHQGATAEARETLEQARILSPKNERIKYLLEITNEARQANSSPAPAAERVGSHPTEPTNPDDTTTRIMKLPGPRPSRTNPPIRQRTLADAFPESGQEGEARLTPGYGRRVFAAAPGLPPERSSGAESGRSEPGGREGSPYAPALSLVSSHDVPPPVAAHPATEESLETEGHVATDEGFPTMPVTEPLADMNYPGQRSTLLGFADPEVGPATGEPSRPSPFALMGAEAPDTTIESLALSDRIKRLMWPLQAHHVVAAGALFAALGVALILKLGPPRHKTPELSTLSEESTPVPEQAAKTVRANDSEAVASRQDQLALSSGAPEQPAKQAAGPTAERQSERDAHGGNPFGWPIPKSQREQNPKGDVRLATADRKVDRWTSGAKSEISGARLASGDNPSVTDLKTASKAEQASHQDMAPHTADSPTKAHAAAEALDSGSLTQAQHIIETWLPSEETARAQLLVVRGELAEATPEGIQDAELRSMLKICADRGARPSGSNTSKNNARTDSGQVVATACARLLAVHYRRMGNQFQANRYANQISRIGAAPTRLAGQLAQTLSNLGRPAEAARLLTFAQPHGSNKTGRETGVAFGGAQSAWGHIAVTLARGERPTTQAIPPIVSADHRLLAVRMAHATADKRALSEALRAVGGSKHYRFDDDLHWFGTLARHQSSGKGVRFAQKLKKRSVSPLGAYVAGQLAGNHRHLAAFWLEEATRRRHPERCRAAWLFRSTLRELGRAGESDIWQMMRAEDCAPFRSSTTQRSRPRRPPIDKAKSESGSKTRNKTTTGTQPTSAVQL